MHERTLEADDIQRYIYRIRKTDKKELKIKMAVISVYVPGG